MPRATAGLTPFVSKLNRILEDPHSFKYIRWAPSGNSFLILDAAEFSSHVLPYHFKHTNLNSFVRQLNKYDFHKIKSDDSIKEEFGDQVWEFVNTFFIAGRPDLMAKIERKKTNSSLKTGEEMINASESEEMYAVDNQHNLMLSSYFVKSIQMITELMESLQLEFEELKSFISQNMKPYLDNKGVNGENLLNASSLNSSLAANTPKNLNNSFKNSNYKPKNVSNNTPLNSKRHNYTNSNCTILIAEENINSSELATKYLMASGFNISKIQGYEDFRKFSNTFIYDGILLSEDIPEIGSIISHIRKDNPNIPIILSREAGAIMPNAISGVTGVVQKPFEAKILAGVFVHALQNARINPNSRENISNSVWSNK